MGGRRIVVLCRFGNDDNEEVVLARVVHALPTLYC
jgi:hypothetical protein